VVWLQGLDDPKLIFQVLPASLSGRTFELALHTMTCSDNSVVETGLMYMAYPDSCWHKISIPAEAEALPHEGASAHDLYL